MADEKFVMSAIQMASGPNVSANLLEAERLLDIAVGDGAQLIVLPENFACMGMTDADNVTNKEVLGKGPIQEFLSRQAAKHEIWLVGGTIPIDCGSEEKARAACLVFNDKGERVARYDKVHLFDVTVVDSGEEYTESATIEAGNELQVIDTPFGKLGLAICYDLRFPELFRMMLEKGMEILAIPSAFTAITGGAHWEVLVRARAVENLSYVIAAAQGGFHMNGKETYGHSMVVDPWGKVLGEQGSKVGAVTVEVNRGNLEKIRDMFPVIKHRRIHCHCDS
jgi:deaminated glutathione amidase